MPHPYGFAVIIDRLFLARFFIDRLFLTDLSGAGVGDAGAAETARISRSHMLQNIPEKPLKRAGFFIFSGDEC